VTRKSKENAATLERLSNRVSAEGIGSISLDILATEKYPYWRKIHPEAAPFEAHLHSFITDHDPRSAFHRGQPVALQVVQNEQVRLLEEDDIIDDSDGSVDVERVAYSQDSVGVLIGTDEIVDEKKTIENPSSTSPTSTLQVESHPDVVVDI